MAEIDLADLTVLDLLGCGAFGAVYRAQWRGSPVGEMMCRFCRLSPSTVICRLHCRRAPPVR